MPFEDQVEAYTLSAVLKCPACAQNAARLEKIEEKLDRLLFILDDYAVVGGKLIDVKGIKRRVQI